MRLRICAACCQCSCRVGTKSGDALWTEILLYSVFGRAFSIGPFHIPAAPEDRVHMAAFIKKLPQWILDGALKPIPVRVWEGGLEGVLGGLQYIREGKASGEKIVCRV